MLCSRYLDLFHVIFSRSLSLSTRGSLTLGQSNSNYYYNRPNFSGVHMENFNNFKSLFRRTIQAHRKRNQLTIFLKIFLEHVNFIFKKEAFYSCFLSLSNIPMYKLPYKNIEFGTFRSTYKVFVM